MPEFTPSEFMPSDFPRSDFSRSDFSRIDGTALKTLLQGTNLYLIGMMGAGKTTIGKLLASQVGYQFFDTDAVVEQVAGQAIADLFTTAGEATFRELETRVLGELAAYKQLVIATGGGIVLQPQNWSYLHHGVVIWLDVPVTQLMDRLKATSDRPLLQTPNPQETLHQLLEQRRSLYSQADICIAIQADDTPEYTIHQIMAAVGSAIQTKRASTYFNDN